MSRKDTRIVYGARCTWWDSIDHVSTKRAVPTCPHCGSPLFELDDEASWWRQVERYQREHPEDASYRDMMAWARGRCFPTFEALRRAWQHDQQRQLGLPERDPRLEDLMGALAYLVATRHDGSVQLETEAMAGKGYTLGAKWAVGADGKPLLVLTAELVDRPAPPAPPRRPN